MKVLGLPCSDGWMVQVAVAEVNKLMALLPAAIALGENVGSNPCVTLTNPSRGVPVFQNIGSLKRRRPSK